MIEELNENVVDIDSERNNFEKTMVLNFDKKNIFNADEQGLTIVSLRKELIVKKSKKKIVELLKTTSFVKTEKD